VIQPGFDNYRIGAFDAELSLAWTLGKDARVTLSVANLLNEPMREWACLEKMDTNSGGFAVV
jgi:hypothetical protein